MCSIIHYYNLFIKRPNHQNQRSAEIRMKQAEVGTKRLGTKWPNYKLADEGTDLELKFQTSDLGRYHKSKMCFGPTVCLINLPTGLVQDMLKLKGPPRWKVKEEKKEELKSINQSFPSVRSEIPKDLDGPLIRAALQHQCSGSPAPAGMKTGLTLQRLRTLAWMCHRPEQASSSTGSIKCSRSRRALILSTGSVLTCPQKAPSYRAAASRMELLPRVWAMMRQMKTRHFVSCQQPTFPLRSGLARWGRWSLRSTKHFTNQRVINTRSIRLTAKDWTGPQN